MTTRSPLYKSMYRPKVLVIVAMSLIFASTSFANSPDLKRVMLSSGGVGYFEYEAEVDGDTELELSVRLDQVDDVLKSIVIYDDKGGVGTIRLQSQASLDEIFRELPFGPESLSSMDRMLSAMKGAEVQTEGPRRLTGRIASVVKETERTDEGLAVTRHRVGLITESGLQHFILENAQTVKFTDTDLDARIKSALEKMADRSAQDNRTLIIRSPGTEKRKLTVGYVAEVPLWKASYRLILPRAEAATEDKESAKARIQGWAVVDNASSQDWQDVELKLTSGNPVTFRQALYATYYVDRPEVPLEVMGKILPNPDEGAISGDELRREQDRARQLGRMRDAEGFAMAAPAMEKAMDEVPQSVNSLGSGNLFFGGSDVEEKAASAESAAQIEFAFAENMSVENGQSLVVPIIDRKIPAERVYVYDPKQLNAVGITHRPFASVRLMNDSSTSLPPGALTLYETDDKGIASFIGDAQMKTLPKGEKRFVSYALDEKTFVDSEYKDQPDQIVLAKLSDGFLIQEKVNNYKYTYDLKAPEEEPRHLILVVEDGRGEFDNSDKLSYEKAQSDHRIGVDLEAGEQKSVELNFRQTTSTRTRFLDINLNQLGLLFKNVPLGPELKKVVDKITQLKKDISAADQTMAQARRTIDGVYKEQERIRENIKALHQGASTDIYKRYLAKLDTQENELERLNTQIAAAQTKRASTQRELEDLIRSLDFEIRDGRVVRSNQKKI